MSKKLTIVDAQEAAIKKGGLCISKSYKNNKEKLIWRCAKKHEWRANLDTIRNRGHWCPVCARNQQKTIDDMHQHAERMGGRCLSQNYINKANKLKWQCSVGHIWEASGGHILNSGSWCPACAGRPILSISDMRKMAQKRGGDCLSTTYINQKTKLKWSCGKGHVWEAAPNNIRNNKTWCPVCSGSAVVRDTGKIELKKSPLKLKKLRQPVAHEEKAERDTHLIYNKSKERKKERLKVLQKKALEHGGRCLSEEYITSSTKMLWECEKGHKWEATADAIKNSGSWCLTCSGSRKKNIEEMQALAFSRGGKCLSENYVNSHTKIKWECSLGHVWDAKPYGVVQGSWCPTCNIYYHEEYVRALLEGIFKSEFPKERPKWLINPKTKSPLELDGYNQALGIAFEYNGIQHYKKTFFESNSSLAEIKRRDKFKIKKCSENSVLLITIKYNEALETLPNKIKNMCLDFGINIDVADFNFELKTSDIYVKSNALSEMDEIANKRGGKCLSSAFLGMLSNLDWECAFGHKWSATPSSIKTAGTWCLICAGNAPHDISFMNELAEQKGGKCLSEVYVNQTTKLLWECKNGHQWKAVPKNIIHRDAWCDKCARITSSRGKKRNTIEQMNQIANLRGGKCLSEAYVNQSTQLWWECNDGHQWKATPKHIKRSVENWCKTCKKKN